MYFNKFMPVIDSDCVMNRICKYIEGVDFKIRQKVRSSHNFDYKILMGQNFNINKKLYIKIKDEVEKTFKEWEEQARNKRANRLDKNTTHENSSKKMDKEIEYGLLKARLEEICSNEEQLTNHLIYLFYEDKPSLSKTTLWSLVGTQIFENIKSKTQSFYFSIKNPNGSLEFLYENYSIERIAVISEDENEDNGVVTID